MHKDRWRLAGWANCCSAFPAQIWNGRSSTWDPRRAQNTTRSWIRSWSGPYRWASTSLFSRYGSARVLPKLEIVTHGAAPHQAAAPKTELLPPNDAVSVTVILLTCSYMNREFVRVGYYVNNEYDDEAMREAPPQEPQFERVVRNILADKPRVTRFPIAWTRGSSRVLCYRLLHASQNENHPQRSPRSSCPQSTQMSTTSPPKSTCRCPRLLTRTRIWRRAMTWTTKRRTIWRLDRV